MLFYEVTSIAVGYEPHLLVYLQHQHLFCFSLSVPLKWSALTPPGCMLLFFRLPMESDVFPFPLRSTNHKIDLYLEHSGDNYLSFFRCTADSHSLPWHHSMDSKVMRRAELLYRQWTYNIFKTCASSIDGCCSLSTALVLFSLSLSPSMRRYISCFRLSFPFLLHCIIG